MRQTYLKQTFGPTFPERVTLVTKPRAVLPAGSTSSPFLRIVVTRVARTKSSTPEVPG
jgi:hypothetical protein